MAKEHSHTKRGFSIVEALLAGSLFVLIIPVFIGAIIYGEESTQISGGLSRAAYVTEEGMEAARNIRDNSFTNVTVGTNGLAISGNQWVFLGAQDVIDIFTRQVGITRNLLGSGSRSVSATTTWTKTQQREGSLNIFSYLTNWRGCRGGILVYGDGGTANDAINYKVLQGDDRTNCTWSSVASAADVDTGTSNRALRAAQIYASSSRHEKIMLSRHYDGAVQYIYAQVYDGAAGTWGNVQLLSSWSATTFSDVQNFSGTYLANGDFMVVYSDNTTTPKFRTWDGSVWSGEVSTHDIGGIPNYVIVRARPGTNEVMAVFFDQAKDTNTQYFNGGAYMIGSWALHAEHANDAFSSGGEHIDFVWSPNNSLEGGLVYSISDNDKSMHIKIWMADGGGGGSWSLAANSTVQTRAITTLALGGRREVDEFIACNKDTSPSPKIICYKSNSTPTWTDPVNQTIVSGTDQDMQRSFDIGFESASGDPAIAVYSDQTSIPKLKKYTASISTWDSGATSLGAVGTALETVRIIPHPGTDEMMILLGNTSQDVYGVVWDGGNNIVYATPGGYAFTAHGLNGASDADYWYDFAWDLY